MWRESLQNVEVILTKCGGHPYKMWRSCFQRGDHVPTQRIGAIPPKCKSSYLSGGRLPEREVISQKLRPFP